MEKIQVHTPKLVSMAQIRITQDFSVDLSLYPRGLDHEGKAVTFIRVQMRLVKFYGYLKKDI